MRFISRSLQNLSHPRSVLPSCAATKAGLHSSSLPAPRSTGMAMGQVHAQASRLSMLVVDFDETCTAHDTTSVLMAAAASARQQARAAGGSDAEAEEVGLPQRLSQNYVSKQQALLSQLLPEAEAGGERRFELSAAAEAGGGEGGGIAGPWPPPSAAPRYDRMALEAFLSRLSDFDVEMNHEALDQGAAAGLTLAQLRWAARGVTLRPGCCEALAAASQSGLPVHVLSVNWSGEFVTEALGHLFHVILPEDLVSVPEPRELQLPISFCQPRAGGAAAAAWGPRDALLCNELVLGPDGRTGRKLRALVQCALDKGRAFSWLQAAGGCIEAWRAGRSTSPSTAPLEPASEQPQGGVAPEAASDRPGFASSATEGGPPARRPDGIVFVGDSTSDLLPLLDADLGIVIGTNKLLRRVGARFGIQLLPLPKVLAPALQGGSPARLEGVLYVAESWRDISEHLGLQGHEEPASGTAPAAYAPPDTTGATPVGPPPAPASKAVPPSVLAVAVASATYDVGAASALAAPAASSSGVPPRVLVVAGSDSGAGAGVQADLKAIMACGAFGTSALTALTAQNTHGVHGVHVPPVGFLEQQVDIVMSDMGADVIKTGMLPSAEVVRAVAAKVRQHGRPTLVVDPVLVSTSGHSLAAGGVVSSLLNELLPLASVVTPNIPEAVALLGGVERICCVGDMEAAARKLQRLTGCGAVLVKGGHLLQEQMRRRTEAAAAGGPGSPAAAADAVGPGGGAATVGRAGAGEDEVVDVLFDGERMWRLALPRVQTGNTHGTGCTLASAISAYLARGLPLLASVRLAKRYVQQALEHSSGLAVGGGVQRPFDHGFFIAQPAWAAPASSGRPRLLLDAEAPPGTGEDAEVGGRCLDRSIGGVEQGDVQDVEVGGSERLEPALVRRWLRLYAVTDAGCNAKAGRSIREAVQMAVEGGATIVQVREKDVGGRSFLEAARAAYQVCCSANVPLVINDRIDVALALGPDVGVHVGQDDLPAAEARRLLGPDRLLGVSVKTVQQAEAAALDGADYLGCGAVYPTATKDSGVIGIGGLREVCAAATVPVVAIGGVSVANAVEAVRAGAAGVAVISAVFAAADARAATAELRAVVSSALQGLTAP